VAALGGRLWQSLARPAPAVVLGRRSGRSNGPFSRTEQPGFESDCWRALRQSDVPTHGVVVVEPRHQCSTAFLRTGIGAAVGGAVIGHDPLDACPDCRAKPLIEPDPNLAGELTDRDSGINASMLDFAELFRRLVRQGVSFARNDRMEAARRSGIRTAQNLGGRLRQVSRWCRCGRGPGRS
jgi:hypothetical protein